jgi:hypothetical protein
MKCWYCHKQINRLVDSQIIFVYDKTSKAAHYTCAEPYIEQHHENYLEWEKENK